MVDDGEQHFEIFFCIDRVRNIGRHDDDIACFAIKGVPPMVIFASPSKTWTMASPGAEWVLTPSPAAKENRVMVTSGRCTKVRLTIFPGSTVTRPARDTASDMGRFLLKRSCVIPPVVRWYFSINYGYVGLQNRFLENIAADSDFRQFDGNFVSGVGHGALCKTDQATAAGDFHINNMDKFNIVGLDNVGEFFPVKSGVIEFGTADYGDFAFHETTVKIREGKAVQSAAISREARSRYGAFTGIRES